jgi:telomere length regulation protein
MLFRLLQLRSLAAALRKQDDVKGVLAGLGRIEVLIRSCPDELGPSAHELSRALLYCRVPEWAEVEDPR